MLRVLPAALFGEFAGFGGVISSDDFAVVDFRAITFVGVERVVLREPLDAEFKPGDRVDLALWIVAWVRGDTPRAAELRRGDCAFSLAETGFVEIEGAVAAPRCCLELLERTFPASTFDDVEAGFSACIFPACNTEQLDLESSMPRGCSLEVESVFETLESSPWRGEESCSVASSLTPF